MWYKQMDELLKETENLSLTENGAAGYETTGKALVDFNFKIPWLRKKCDDFILKEFYKAWDENPRFAVKFLFMMRDIRGKCGLGERRIFRVVFKDLLKKYPEKVSHLISLIPHYGRWDDLIGMLYADDLPDNIVDEIVELIRKELENDLSQMKNKKEVSLLAKWMPSANTTSVKTKILANFLIHKLGMTPRNYRKMLSSLRSYIKVVETYFHNRWDEINYEEVPSCANLKYKDAFLRHDEERRGKFLEDVKHGKKKINSGVVFPHEIVAKYSMRTISDYSYKRGMVNEDFTIERMWENLPNYITDEKKVIVVCDGSGSMVASGPSRDVCNLDISTALAIYCAERLTGEFHNKFITFGADPHLVDLGGDNLTLLDKLEICGKETDCSNTNIHRVFKLILASAIEAKVKQEDMPDSILIISDMEFDPQVNLYKKYEVDLDGYGVEKLFKVIGEEYETAGYKLPKLIFWNVGSRTNTIPAIGNDNGLILVSGFSTKIFTMILGEDVDPYQMILRAILSEDYEKVELSAD